MRSWVGLLVVAAAAIDEDALAAYLLGAARGKVAVDPRSRRVRWRRVRWRQRERRRCTRS